MYQAVYIGMIASLLCMIPYILISFFIARKRKQFLKSKGIDDYRNLSEEEMLIIEKELEESEKGQRIHIILSLSLILVYPALIGNAITKGNTLTPWFIFLCCFLTYSGITLLIKYV